MFIDPATGRVTLPNDFVIGPDLTQEAFRSTPVGSTARSRDSGTLPFIHYSFSSGNVEERELLASLCFYDQVLLTLHLTVNLYSPKELADWSHYSVEVEAETKVLHERLLSRLLGKSTICDLYSHSPPARLAALDYPEVWNYRWGTIGSYHDSKGGGTFIAVKYGDREEKANAEYYQLRR